MAGFGSVWVAELFIDGETKERMKAEKKTLQDYLNDGALPEWIYVPFPGLLASPLSVGTWSKAFSSANEGSFGPWNFIGGIGQAMTTAGGFCAGILVLKAIFGEKGLASMATGLTSLAGV